MWIFQGRMNTLFSDLKSEALKVNLSDLLHTKGNSSDKFIKQLKLILEILKRASVQVYAKKSTWHPLSWEFLHFWLIRESHPQLKYYVESTLIMAAPGLVNQLHICIDCINFIKNYLP